MQFEINLGDNINPTIYYEFSKYVFDSMKVSLKYQTYRNYKKYKLRERLVLKSSLIKWKRGVVPSGIDLPFYVSNCLELVNIKGKYVIRLNKYWVVKGSTTKVSTLVRLLEHGNDKVPPLPVVSKVFRVYSKYYKSLFSEYIIKKVIDR